MPYNHLVNVIAQRTLRASWQKHPRAETPLRDWEKRMQKSSYRSFSELKAAFPNADYLKIAEAEVTIFNIAGNHYRLISSIKYETQTVFIKKLMTHAEYDQWNRMGRK